jgi:hypothetical protein
MGLYNQLLTIFFLPRLIRQDSQDWQDHEHLKAILLILSTLDPSCFSCPFRPKPRAPRLIRQDSQDWQDHEHLKAILLILSTLDPSCFSCPFRPKPRAPRLIRQDSQDWQDHEHLKAILLILSTLDPSCFSCLFLSLLSLLLHPVQSHAHRGSLDRIHRIIGT